MMILLSGLVVGTSLANLFSCYYRGSHIMHDKSRNSCES